MDGAALTNWERQSVRAYAMGLLQGHAAHTAQRLIDQFLEAMELFERARDLLAAQVEADLDEVTVPPGAEERFLVRLRTDDEAE